ncbi:MAG TPA: hypothetical protein DCL38_04880 [Lachnospiraceae bacterium]|nr:hypothetical protein [Lachnospiraceae bacterium]
MNFFEEVRVILGEKSGKRLAALSGSVFVIITAIVFYASISLCNSIQLKLMDEYMWEIPKILESRSSELNLYTKVYEEDILARAEIGLMLYDEENVLSDAERLQWVREAVSADSVSVLDGEGKPVSVDGTVSMKEDFSTWIETLEPRSPRLELYPARSKNGEATGENDVIGYVRLPLPEDAEGSLLFEFPCDRVSELYNAIEDWSGVLERILSGADAVAYAKTGDELTGYPLDGLTDEQIPQLKEELGSIFENAELYESTGSGRRGRFITLLGKSYFSTITQYKEEGQEDTDILFALPTGKAIRNALYIAVSISLLIGCGILLLQLYAYHRLKQKLNGGDAEKLSHRYVHQATWPGIITVIAVTLIFSGMLLMLESRTNAAVTTTIYRELLQREIDWRKDREGEIRKSIADYCLDSTQMLATVLSEYKDYRTHDTLEALSRVVGADYIMYFDKNGQELAASNSYTGFTIGTDLSEDYRAVLLGYPHVIVGPEADPYTGRMQLGTAVLMTDGDGKPDGFILAAYDAGEVSQAVGQLSYENTVNSFTVHEDHIAAAVSDEDGRFIAHTDQGMIGQRAADFLKGYEPGKSFEGFTDYKGESMCVSASTADGRTLLFMVPERGNMEMQAAFGLIFLAVPLLLGLLYYPGADVLIAKAITEAKGKLGTPDPTINPITVFSDGYALFVTLFAFIALIASLNGWWTSFDYVFGGEWTRGVHLYSLWASLFTLAVTLFCEFLLRRVLKLMEMRLSHQGKTITRLVNSLIIYAANLFLVFCILGFFGVNTAALLASAGVISIAVGMGAQSMASDLLAGFFMMLEGTIRVGDLVNAGGVTGYVTDMGIRTTEITDEEGNVVTLNNSKVSPVKNMSRKQPEKEKENPRKTEN